MPLSVKDGMGAWIKDFQDSNAPQFKGKSEKERREMAIAAYLDAKRGSQKEEVKPPFTPDPPGKKKPTKNSDGTTTGPMSRARQLAKMARDRAMKKEDVELDEAKYSWNDVNDALKKANYMRGNPAHIDRVASKFKYKSGNDKNFTHRDVKKNLSAAGIDGARHHDIMKHMKESVELEEAMTTAIEFPNYFDLSKAEQDKIVKMTKKYKVQTPIEKRGRRNVIIADGPKSEMQKLEKDLKRAGVKFVATESVEYIEEANAYANAGRALADYARKQGGMDKADFNKASKFMYQIGKADILSKGQHLAAFSKFFRDLDTDVRDGIVQILKKQNVMESVEEAFYGTKAQRMMSPLQKARMDKEKRDRDRDGKLKSTSLPMRKKNEEVDLEEDNFEKNFQKRIGATVRGGAGAQYLKKKAQQAQDQNKKLDPGAAKKGLGIGVTDSQKAYQKAKKKGVQWPRGGVRTSPNTRKPGRLPEEVDEAVQFKVDVEGLPPTFMQGKSSAEILGKLRKIVKQPSMIKNVERYTDMEVKRAYKKKAQGRSMDEAKYADPEDNMPPSEDEGKMAIKQAKFIQYVGKELEQYVKNNKEFPEWMQNKISAFHQKSKDVHSILGGDYGDEEQSESTQAYGDTMRKQQRARQQKMMKSGEMDKLQKMRAMLDKEKKK